MDLGRRRYEVVKPPVGLYVKTLPFGFRTEQNFAGLVLFVMDEVYYIKDESTDSFVVIAKPEPPAVE